MFSLILNGLILILSLLGIVLSRADFIFLAGTSTASVNIKAILKIFSHCVKSVHSGIIGYR